MPDNTVPRSYPQHDPEWDLDGIRARLAALEAAQVPTVPLHTNGVGALVDRVGRLEGKVQACEKWLQEQADRIKLLELALASGSETIAELAARVAELDRMPRPDAWRERGGA